MKNTKNIFDVYTQLIVEMNEADEAEKLAHEVYDELNESFVDEDLFVQIFTDEAKAAMKDDFKNISKYTDNLINSTKKFISADADFLEKIKKSFISKLNNYFKK